MTLIWFLYHLLPPFVDFPLPYKLLKPSASNTPFFFCLPVPSRKGQMMDEVRRDLDLVLCALGQPSGWEHLSLLGDNNNVEG